MNDTKICQYCAEEIKAAAIRCRYCHADLASVPADSNEPREAVPVSPAAESHAAPPRAAAPDSARRAAKPKPKTKPKPKPVPVLWLVALVALSLMAAAVVGFFLWDVRQMSETDSARAAGRTTAAEYVEKILSYDHERIDQDVAQATKLMTDGFADEYTSTIEQVREEATATESVVKAEVVASSVVTAGPDRVEALLFVNQTTDGKQVEAPRVDLNRVVVILVRDGDKGWLVSELDAL